MGMRLKSLALTSGQILRELIMDALPQVLGEDSSVISADLPFEGGHLLCLDANRYPALVTFDARDGSRALLAGLLAGRASLVRAIKANPRFWGWLKRLRRRDGEPQTDDDADH